MYCKIHKIFQEVNTSAILTMD